MRGAGTALGLVLAAVGCATVSHSGEPVSARSLEPLIGTWHCTVETSSEDGSPSAGRAVWEFRWILGGTAVMDRWRSWHEDGSELVAVGVRTVDPATGRCTARWLPEGVGLSWREYNGAFHDDELVLEGDGQSPSGEEGRVRITFSDISLESFEWRMDFSAGGSDGWAEGVSRVSCTR